MKKTAKDAANGSLESLAALCVVMRQMPEKQLALLLPVFYANLDKHDIPSADSIDSGTLPFPSLNRIFIAVEAIRIFRGIDPVAIEQLWQRVWSSIQLLEAAHQCKPDSLGTEITCVTFFRTIEMFQDAAGGGPAASMAGVWMLVDQAWRAMLQRHDMLCDDAFHKLCRFIARGVISQRDVEELAEGMGGLKDLAFVLMQHMHLGTANRDDSIYIHGTLKFLIVSEGFVPSLCPALLAAGIVPVLTGFVANLGSHVDKVNSIKRPALLKHSLCILMSTIMRPTSSLYP
jgi:hypothetical protein